MKEYDVVIVGAGASGINAAHMVQTEMPGASYTVLEARDAIGGTWNFFKYPGLRSDSYLTSFGFRWRPWTSSKEIADGPQIQQYLEESTAWAGIDKHIQFRHKVTGLHWSTPDSKWTMQVDVDGGKTTRTLRSTFIFVCSGYYDYATPLQTEIPGLERFGGQVVHPQFWPSDLDYANKRVVIVGSGATAVTLLPVLAKTAASVTMLQRSPTYVVPLPSAPAHILMLRRVLPKWLANHVNFWKDIVFQSFIRFLCFAFPLFVRRTLIRRMDQMLKGSGIPVDPHFTPRYNPWDQRLCVCPDGDFFDALKRANTDIVTDRIETVTESGIRTKNGEHLDADLIVTATGLRVLILGGVDITVDGQKINVPEQFAWRGFMLEGVPNSAMVVGYTSMAWTLGSDACLRMMMRVIKHMQNIGATAVTPVVQHRNTLHSEPVIGMKSTYFLMAHDRLPRKANVDPWNERKGFISESLLTWLSPTKTFTKGLRFSGAVDSAGTLIPSMTAKDSKKSEAGYGTMSRG